MLRGSGGGSVRQEREHALPVVMSAGSEEHGNGNGRDIDFSVDGNDPLSSLCSGKLRTYGASSRVDMSLTPSQALPFEAYKRLVEGFSAPMSVRDCMLQMGVFVKESGSYRPDYLHRMF